MNGEEKQRGKSFLAKIDTKYDSSGNVKGDVECAQRREPQIESEDGGEREKEKNAIISAVNCQ